jgi:hypothetical protein
MTTEESGFDVRQDPNTSLLPTAFEQVIDTSQLPTNIVQAASAPEIKRPGPECDYRTFPSSVEVKNEWIYTLTLSYILVYIFVSYTGCNRRKGQNFGRVFLMLNYTENPRNTYIQS